jgi:hypothetical protein
MQSGKRSYNNKDHEESSSISNGVEASMLIPAPGGLRPRRRAVRCGAELAAGLRGPAQRGARGRERRPVVVGRQRCRVRSELRSAAAGRLRAGALRRAVWREHLLGLRRRRLVGGGRRGVVGGREAVLRLRHQLVRGGADVRPLHTGGVARHHRRWVRPCRLRQQRRRLHHLQLQPAGQRHRAEPVLSTSTSIVRTTYVQTKNKMSSCFDDVHTS